MVNMICQIGLSLDIFLFFSWWLFPFTVVFYSNEFFAFFCSALCNVSMFFRFLLKFKVLKANCYDACVLSIPCLNLCINSNVVGFVFNIVCSTGQNNTASGEDDGGDGGVPSPQCIDYPVASERAISYLKSLGRPMCFNQLVRSE